MNKRWVLKETDPLKFANLQSALNIHPVLLQILVQRGISTFDEAKKFFRPSLSDLHDPFLMKDMDKAIDRIEQAIANNEKILIYGDYDVDGTTAVATAYSFFHELGAQVEYYVPNRYTEGYGISNQGIDWAKENGFTLIIALDCGIKSIDKIDYAKTLSIDFIICDHHLPGIKIPDAIAVLDPKRKDCDYPYKELCGCGIGFKLISAYAQKNNLPDESYLKYLDFVVVSIASDIVPITGENRVLAFYGLEKINRQPSEGLRALMQTNVTKKEFTISDLVFMIGPRINAAGRMDDARNAVKLLISESAHHAVGNAEVLNKHNIDRRGFDSTITEEALAMLQVDPGQTGKKSTVLFQPHWHKGVIGIVASRLIDKWYRPTIVLTESNGLATGSARSVAGFDIYEAILSCSDLLEQFGGHMFAAGLTMRIENLSAFTQRFEEVVSSTIEERYLTPEIEINAVLEMEDITPKFYSMLKQFAPFGPQNMKPVFMTSCVEDTNWSRIVGTDHLKFSLKKGIGSLNGIGFGMGSFLPLVKSKQPFDICYNLDENEWNDKKRIEMTVKDVKEANVPMK
ncbi:MAG: single-stranded-DNA-specific exonuclease RecJ [Chitinophagaceae bacterium]|nr:single-stranded-DNA-specific exonuclease RecJ [Chitinophagaceae bacterium]